MCKPTQQNFVKCNTGMSLLNLLDELDGTHRQILDNKQPNIFPTQHNTSAFERTPLGLAICAVGSSQLSPPPPPRFRAKVRQIWTEILLEKGELQIPSFDLLQADDESETFMLQPRVRTIDSISSKRDIANISPSAVNWSDLNMA